MNRRVFLSMLLLVGVGCGCNDVLLPSDQSDVAKVVANASKSPTPVPTVQHARSAILSEKYASGVTNQCSRSAPKYDGTWQPTEEDIKPLEAKLDDVSKLVVGNDGKTILTVEDINRSYMQYVGVLIEGRRYIYVNAFRALSGQEPLDKDWLTKPVVVCDGGKGFWGVLYDVDAAKFSELAVNGEA